MNVDSGIVIALPQFEHGVSAATQKEWKKADVIIEWGDKFKNQLCVTFFNDKVDLLQKLSVGDPVTVNYTTTSRAWTKDGVTKYFHNVNGQSIDIDVDGGNKSYSANSTGLVQNAPDDGTDTLPF